METTLFRVAQEALLNIHHHAASATAVIRFRIGPNDVTLAIEDRGCGMPSDVVARVMAERSLVGVGLAGMRERLNQLGGSLAIASTADGTVLRATVPLSEAPQAANRSP